MRVQKAELYRSQVDRVGEVFEKDSDFKQKSIENAKNSMFSGYIDGMTDDENFAQNPIFTAAVVGQAEKINKNIFTEVYKSYRSKIEVLEREYKSL